LFNFFSKANNQGGLKYSLICGKTAELRKKFHPLTFANFWEGIMFLFQSCNEQSVNPRRLGPHILLFGTCALGVGVGGGVGVIRNVVDQRARSP